MRVRVFLFSSTEVRDENTRTSIISDRNVFSPHRFLAVPELLAAVTPIHARLVQCLRQYLEHAFGTHTLFVPRDPCAATLGPRSNPVRPLRVDAVRGTIYGEPSAALAELSDADRQRFLERIDYSQLRERAPLPVPSPSPSLSQSQSDELVPVDWRWLFDLSIAALNDVRVDEVCMCTAHSPHTRVDDSALLFF